MRDRIARLLTAAAVLVATTAACSSNGNRNANEAESGREGPDGTTASDAPTMAGEWMWPAPEGASVGMPAADGSGVAFVTSRSRLVVLDTSGALRWEAAHPELRTVPPALTPDLVLVPTEEGLVAFERATGRLRWEAALGDRTNTPAIGGTRAVVTTWEGSLAALDLADGKVAWRTNAGGNILGPPAATGSVAATTFDSGRVAGLTAVDVASGRQKWSVPLDPDGVSAPAITPAGVIVVIAGDVAAHGFSVENGTERWRQPTRGAGSPEVPPLPLADGTVAAAHRLGGIAVFEVRDGSMRWEVASGGAAVRGGPAGPSPNGWFALPLVDGTLLLASKDGGRVEEFPSPVAGVASGPDGLLLVATGKGKENRLSAASGW